MASADAPMRPAWSVYAWPPVLWQADRALDLPFRHLDTSVLESDRRVFPSSGHTVWAMPSPRGEAGMAWDWIMLSQGVVAIADPLGVITNLRLLGPEGEVLTAWQAARHLNEIVHGLAWQREVQRALAGWLN